MIITHTPGRKSLVYHTNKSTKPSSDPAQSTAANIRHPAEFAEDLAESVGESEREKCYPPNAAFI